VRSDEGTLEYDHAVAKAKARRPYRQRGMTPGV
jgi:hypothetical protein